MAELVEVKIMAEFINAYSSIDCYDIEVSPTSINTYGLYDLVIDAPFHLFAETRGEELRVTLFQNSGSPNPPCLFFNFGQNAFWSYTEDEILLDDVRLMIHTEKGRIILTDDDGNSSWQIGSIFPETWKPTLGPDMITEYVKFCVGVVDLKYEHPEYMVGECLANGLYFNGLADYLRAEILYRTDINPFSKFGDLTNTELQLLLENCSQVTIEAFMMGGFRFMHKNPEYADWFKCYGNNSMSNVQDIKGRVLWYNPKWSQSKQFSHDDLS
jgi:endonuclease VIII-like 1